MKVVLRICGSKYFDLIISLNHDFNKSIVEIKPISIIDKITGKEKYEYVDEEISTQSGIACRATPNGALNSITSLTIKSDKKNGKEKLLKTKLQEICL